MAHSTTPLSSRGQTPQSTSAKDPGGPVEKTRRPRVTRRRPPTLDFKDGIGLKNGKSRKSESSPGIDGSNVPRHHPFVRQMAVAIRQRRMEMGWTVAHTAAWCGVGARFLLDLEMAKASLQIERAIGVAAKLGIDLRVLPRHSRDSRHAPEFCMREQGGASGELKVEAQGNWHIVKAPAGCSQPAAWLALCHAGMHMAKNSGLKVLDHQVDIQNGLLKQIQINTSPWTGCAEDPEFLAMARYDDAKTVQVRPPWSMPTPDACWEENGGAGIRQALAYIQARSSSPVQDTEQLIRWIIFSVVCLDGEANLGRLRFLKSDTTPFVFMGALGEILCASTHFESRPHRGLKIVNVWPELHLREDHWRKLADLAGIHPKVIFLMMREMSARAPGLLDEALQSTLGEIPRTSAMVHVIKGVRAAATRMGDLSLAAARNNISGLKTKTQPKIKPVQTRITIEPTRRYISVVDQE